MVISQDAFSPNLTGGVGVGVWGTKNEPGWLEDIIFGFNKKFLSSPTNPKWVVHVHFLGPHSITFVRYCKFRLVFWVVQTRFFWVVVVDDVRGYGACEHR